MFELLRPYMYNEHCTILNRKGFQIPGVFSYMGEVFFPLRVGFFSATDGVFFRYRESFFLTGVWFFRNGWGNLMVRWGFSGTDVVFSGTGGVFPIRVSDRLLFMKYTKVLKIS
jgi:hypothetical protein